MQPKTLKKTIIKSWLCTELKEHVVVRIETHVRIQRKSGRMQLIDVRENSVHFKLAQQWTLEQLSRLAIIPK